MRAYIRVEKHLFINNKMVKSKCPNCNRNRTGPFCCMMCGYIYDIEKFQNLSSTTAPDNIAYIENTN